MQPWSRVGASVEGQSRREVKLQVGAQASDVAATPAKRGLGSSCFVSCAALPRNVQIVAARKRESGDAGRFKAPARIGSCLVERQR